MLARAAAPHLRSGGAIVNVASLAGMVPVPQEAAYSASKAGLRAFSRVLHGELRARDPCGDRLAMPWFSGKLCTLGYLSPRLMGALRPALERRGERNKRALIERRAAHKQ